MKGVKAITACAKAAGKMERLLAALYSRWTAACRKAYGRQLEEINESLARLHHLLDEAIITLSIKWKLKHARLLAARLSDDLDLLQKKGFIFEKNALKVLLYQAKEKLLLISCLEICPVNA